MSKIGRLPIDVPQEVNITIEGKNINLVGSKGSVSYVIPDGVYAELKDGKLNILLEDKQNENLKPIYGLVRANVANIVKGVSVGFEKKLEMSGVGYRAQVTGNDLTLSVGFSHPVKIIAPAGIKFSVTDNVISVIGIDIALVGNIAANIRAIRKPEPYKGKGIQYKGEKIRRKAGKAAKAVGGTAK